MMKKLFLLLILAFPLSGGAASNSECAFCTSAENDVTDIESLRRGAEIFANYCISCHSASLIRYSRIAEDLGWTSKELADVMLKGDTSQTKSPVTSVLTEAEGLKAYGVLPPDLTLIAKSKGVDYIFNYLSTYYLDENEELQNYIFPGSAMPSVFTAEQGLQTAVYKTDSEGNKKIVDIKDLDADELNHVDRLEREVKFRNKLRDLVNFLDYTSEPAQLKRFALGHKVLLYVLLLIVLSFLLKKAYWRHIK